LTQDKFIQLVQHPEMLSTISYEELKTMAFAYPYAHNLRYLLALKAQQEQHPDAARTLQSAATYSLDRRQLFMLVAPPKLTPVRVQVAREEVLELKPIETIQRELEARTPVQRESVRQEPPVQAALPSYPEPAPAPVLPEGLDETALTAPMEVEKPALVHNVSFTDWALQFHPPALQEKPVKAPSARAKALDKEPVTTGVAQTLAEKSVSENQELISETLAKLLVRQGYKEKAINMYQRLSLAFPEKSAYFAAEIDKLKN
jgi:hypothetical protein